MMRMYQLECVAGRKQGRSEREGNQKRGQSFEERKRPNQIKRQGSSQVMTRKRQTRGDSKESFFPKAEPGIERASEGV